MTNWFNGLMGKASAPTQGLSVSTLLDRVQNATTSEDRRKAISDLRTLADNPMNIKTIGVEGLPILMKRLRNERTDVDGSRGIIQLLISIMSISGSELRTAPLGSPQYENVTLFVKDPSNSALILSLLEEKDRNIRYFSTKLLTYLLANKGSEIEAAVMQSPAHITRLIDLLKLGSEMIRNEALLLLIEISKTNVELQKVIAYESGFENLLDIIESEGLANGGIVVQDCLLLIKNLLIGNTSNQNHFREMGCAPRISEMLQIEASDMWIMSEDRRDNIILTMDAICALLSSPSSVPVTPEMVKTILDTSSTKRSISSFIKPSSSIQQTQTHLGTTSVLPRTAKVVMSTIKTPGIRTKARWLLGDLVFCHPQNAAFLEKQDFKDAAGTGRISALLQNTILLFFSNVPTEALAALHVLKCYFHDNSAAQRLFAATIASPQTQSAKPVPTNNEISALLHEPYPARIIIGHLIGWESHADSIKTFYAAMSLSYILNGNSGVKEQLLKLPFEPPVAGVPIENLLSKLVKWLLKAIQINAELPVIVALLRCLGTWLEDCPLAVNHFRTNSANVAFLTNLLASPATDVHISGLTAYLYLLVLDPTAPQTPDAIENSTPFLARLDALRKTPEFSAAERGGPRTADEEAKLPFYDASFVLAFLKSRSILAYPSSNGGQPANPHNAISSHVAAPHVVISSPHPASVVRPSTSDPASNPSPFDLSPLETLLPRFTNGLEAPDTHSNVHPTSNHYSHFAHTNGHHHPPHNHQVTTTSPQILSAVESAGEMTALRLQVATLVKEKQAWIFEKQSLETQLQHAHGRVNHLQTQLQAAMKQNEQISAQLLQTPAPTQIGNPELHTQYNNLKSEYAELTTAHEDLLILLAETQDEVESLRGGALLEQHLEHAEDIL